MRIVLAIAIALAMAWSGYWFIGSSALRSGVVDWFETARSEGWMAEYGDLSVRGFPSRFDATLTDVSLADPKSGLGWQAPFFQLLTLSYTPNHVIGVWPHRQQVQTSRDSYTLDTEDMRASVILDASTAISPRRITLTAKGITLSPESREGAVSAASLRLAAQRLEDVVGTENARYHLGLAAKDVAPPAPLMVQIDEAGTVPRVIETLMADVLVDFDVPWDRRAVEEARPQPTRIAIKNAEIEWGTMSLGASGVLSVDLGGRPNGTLTVKVRHWHQLLEVATRAKWLEPDVAATFEKALSALAGMQDNARSLEVSLRMTGGLIWIGPLPVGPAPVLRLR